jgi:hypothetical protein
MPVIHVNRGATRLGAFSEEEVREGLRTGRFTSTDIGWREGMATWKSLSQFEEFTAAASGAPPPPPSAVSCPSVAAETEPLAIMSLALGATGLPGSIAFRNSWRGLWPFSTV